MHAEAGGARVVWQSDFLPDEVEPDIDGAMNAGAGAMWAAPERLADRS